MEARQCGRGKGFDWINIQQSLKTDSLRDWRRRGRRAGSGRVLSGRASEPGWGGRTSRGSPGGSAKVAVLPRREVGGQEG